MIKINECIEGIEEVVCIREIWRCNAGWGIIFVPDPQRNPTIFHPAQNEETIVFAYYPTLEECIRTEYTYWVQRKNLKGYPEHAKSSQMA